ncbi:MAG: hypothetical protein J5588_00470 [Bacteroidales bacterium]|nr:hypothetical protein [Bacteroidales bacterium]
MKKIILTVAMAIAALLSFAQIPQTFSYQGVVRDAESKIVAEKPITVSVQILQGTDEGTEVYAETHEVTTNANGLMTFELGSKNAEDFAKIDWSNAPYFVKTVAEFDGKQISGVTPLLAVPYALYAAKAGNADVDLSAYATKEEIPSTDGFATKEDLNALSIPSVEGLASESYVNEKVAEIEIPSTDGFATKDELNALNIPSVEGLASESYVNEKVAEIDLSNYYLKADVDALLAEMNAKIKKLDKQLNPPIPGAIEFAFSVSETKKVYFSQGNLQYQASTGTWRFAEHQYDMIGDDNANISSTNSGWIDLFGWGTSGWNSGANAYQPYSTSTKFSDYYPGGDYNNNLTGDYANADWGVNNAISNGGNKAGLWRTLTKDEWVYVINTRTDASNKKGVATVNSVPGLILLPDEWTLPADVTFTSGANGDFAQNTYSAEEWTKMEANGAVFLLAAGGRDGTGVYGVGSLGDYWSSSASGSNYASYLDFYSRSVDTNNDSRDYGHSVRLVQDAE